MDSLRITTYRGFPIYIDSGKVYTMIRGDRVEANNLGELKAKIDRQGDISALRHYNLTGDGVSLMIAV